MDQCACHGQLRLPDSAVWAFINHHLRPVARVSPTATVWMCPATLTLWRLLENEGGQAVLVRD